MIDTLDAGTPGATILGYPRIGPRRELKRALEAHWAGRLDEDELLRVGADLRRDTWTELHKSGLDSVPGNTFSFYDQVLDTTALVGAVPDRFRRLDLPPLQTYFAMARGHGTQAPQQLTKLFDTNYHYLVPELDPHLPLTLTDRKPIDEYVEARALGVPTRPVVLGPVTYLLLAKAAPGAPSSFRPLDRLDDLLRCYAELLSELARAGATWVQLDEPAFTADRSPDELRALSQAYDVLGGTTQRPRLMVTAGYGDLGPALPVLASSPVEALALDLVAGARTVQEAASVGALRSTTVLAGVVDGRNVWRTDLDAALATCATLLGTAESVVPATSCSLLHVPYDVEAETGLDPALHRRLAFARQKVAEVALLGRALREGTAAVADELAAARESRGGRSARNDHVRGRVDALAASSRRRSPYPARSRAQRATLRLGPLPTTTIGSFPQTAQIRRDRADHRAGTLETAEYQRRMRAEIERVIRLQEDIGLDVLVHGEPERNDMVQYFAEHLDGFAATEHGWVQSYGSRCVRPPVLHGDVSRPAPITVPWSAYAQSLTDKPVKAMLTGPVTILAWSFVRTDQPLASTAMQVALALRDEVRDLEAAGLRIVQVDEPALRELLPLRAQGRGYYLTWAVNAFRLATGGAADSTQVHTHLCYSEFSDVVEAIDAMDADVTSVEAARSRMEVLAELAPAVPRGLGPGIYDVHSPQVPSVEDLEQLLEQAERFVPRERLWVNPDCGLKTRSETEVDAALRNLVQAARRLAARGPYAAQNSAAQNS